MSVAPDIIKGHAKVTTGSHIVVKELCYHGSMLSGVAWSVT